MQYPERRVSGVIASSFLKPVFQFNEEVVEVRGFDRETRAVFQRILDVVEIVYHHGRNLRTAIILAATLSASIRSRGMATEQCSKSEA